MPEVSRDIVYALVAAAFVAWAVGMGCSFIVGAEFLRVKRAGGLPHIDFASRGLPFQVIFTSALPRVERQRRMLVAAIVTFFGLCAIAAGVIAIYGPHHP